MAFCSSARRCRRRHGWPAAESPTTIGKKRHAPRSGRALYSDALFGCHQLCGSGGALGRRADDRRRIPYFDSNTRLFSLLISMELCRLPDLMGLCGRPARAARDHGHRLDDLVAGNRCDRLVGDLAGVVREPARHGRRGGELGSVDRAAGARMGAGGSARAVSHDCEHRQLGGAGIGIGAVCLGREPLWLAHRLFRHGRCGCHMAGRLGDLVSSTGWGCC